MSNPSRVPAGVPTGGQFAASAHAESGVSLADPTALRGGQEWQDDIANSIADLADGQAISISGPYGRPANILCHRRTSQKADGTEVPGCTSGTYIVTVAGAEQAEFDFDNLDGNENDALRAAARHIDEQFTATTLDHAPAVLAAVAHAKEQGRPVQINTNGLASYAFDPGTNSSACGDTSLGVEPSRRTTWATGNDDEPFITVTETAYATGRRDGDVHDLDYDAWNDHERAVKREHDRINGHPEQFPAVRYGAERMTEWIGHTSMEDIGGTETRSDVTYEGSAVTYNSLRTAEGFATSDLRRIDFSLYEPQNWK